MVTGVIEEFFGNITSYGRMRCGGEGCVSDEVIIYGVDGSSYGMYSLRASNFYSNVDASTSSP